MISLHSLTTSIQRHIMFLITTLREYQSALTLIIVIFGPTLLPRILTYLSQRKRPKAPKPPRPPIPSLSKVVLAVHTTYFLSELSSPPYDVFVSHNLPILASNDTLRKSVLRTPDTLHPSTTDTPHPLVDLLLTRLQNLDYRFFYARFGHRTLLQCVWCQDINDFMLVSLPGIMLPYILEATFIGMMGWRWVGGNEASRRAERWRSTFAWTLGVLCVVECGAKYFWDIRAVEGDCLHVRLTLLPHCITAEKASKLSSTMHTIRSIVLLLTPITYTFLPIPSPKPSISALIPALSNITSTIRLTSLSRSAVARSPLLRQVWTRLGEREGMEARAGREDWDVRQMAVQEGLSEVEARAGAARWVREGWAGMIRIEEGEKVV